MDTVATRRLNTFAGLSHVLDRTAERRDDESWVAAQAASPTARYLLMDARGDVFVHRDDDRLRWLDAGDRARWLADAEFSFLGVTSQGATFLMAIEDSRQVEALEAALDARRASLRSAGLLLPADEAGLFAYAKGLTHWQRETRHCTYCGAPLQRVSSGHRAQCTNAGCARLHFPRTDAAVIMLVEHDGACLLGRQANWPAGRYSTLAGFVEPGEALEDAVRREVAEEAGVIVGEVHYHSSQPWPMPASLMIGFIATAVSREIVMRDNELEDARWFTPQQIVDGIADGSFVPSMALSVSYQLLASWLQGQAGIDLAALVAGHSSR